MLKKVDIEAKTIVTPTDGGSTALAIAIRTGVSRGVYHFVDDFTKDKMKLGNYVICYFKLLKTKMCPAFRI